MPSRCDKVEYEKRVRIVQEWILDDYPYTDMVTQIVTKWQIEERQAKKYIREARKRWSENEQTAIEQKLRLKIESLKKLKRSLKDKYQGTPMGIMAILKVEQEICKLQNLYPAKQVELSGKNGAPLYEPQSPAQVLSFEQLYFLKYEKWPEGFTAPKD